jgi:hypothetical protein
VVRSGELLAAALRYAEMGYPLFPCAPGGKAPLTEHGFHDATIDPEQIERWWTQHPSANIGIPTHGLVVIDIDGDGNPWPGGPERMLDLAAGPMALTPRGGSHRLFRQPAGKHWRCTEGRLAPKVDTRADGGYIVAPPSIVEGGKAYRWAPGLELDDPPDRLPEPPPWLAQELDRLAAPAPKSGQAAPPANGTPTLAHVAAGSPEANAIPEGQRNATLARLGGNMRRVGMSQAEIAAALLRVNTDRCVPALSPREVERIAASIARYEPDQIAVALTENHWDQMYAEAPADEDAAANPDPGPIPDHLLCVPGFIEEVMAYTLATAPYPERSLAFCGALALQALLAGRKVRDEADNRTNLYLLGLANSGAGKDYPRKVNQRILLHVGMSDSIGDTFASGEGVEDRLFVQPSVLFQTDEIDGLMTKINLGKDARHEGIMNVLLKMYTSASALYPMRVKAGKEAGVIDQPCLCIFGTAIPKHYYEALSLKMLTNGFFARMLILETGKRGRGQDAVVRDPPASVLEAARWWVEFAPGEQRGNLAGWHPVPKVVERTPEAGDVLRAFRQRADDQYSLAEDQGDPVGMAIWARANEKARRLALVYACSASHLDPRIDTDAARWACAFVEHQTRRMLFMAAEYVSENEFDARCKKLVVKLRTWQDKHGDAWMPFWQINRKHPWSEREHEEVRTTLLNQRLIEYAETKTAGRPSKLYRLVAAS